DDEAVGQQVQAQVRVGGVRGRGVEVDLGAHDDDVDAAYLVALGEGVERGGGGRVGRRGAEGRGGVPDVEGRAVVGDGRQAEAPRRPRLGGGRRGGGRGGRSSHAHHPIGRRWDAGVTSPVRGTTPVLHLDGDLVALFRVVCEAP